MTNKLLFASVFLFAAFPLAAFASSHSYTSGYTSSGTFSVPSSYSSLSVTVNGAGGGGGGGGGGMGGSRRNGCSGNGSPGGSGAAGGTASFGSSVPVVAYGGAAGAGGGGGYGMWAGGGRNRYIACENGAAGGGGAGGSASGGDTNTTGGGNAGGGGGSGGISPSGSGNGGPGGAGGAGGQAVKTWNAGDPNAPAPGQNISVTVDGGGGGGGGGSGGSTSANGSAGGTGSAGTVTISWTEQDLPDLIANAPSVSGNLWVDGSATFTGTVLNQGPVATGNSFTSLFQIDLTGPNFNDTDTYATTTVATALSSGGSSSQKTIYLTSGSSWTVPPDWNSSDNTIAIVGAGGGGGVGNSSYNYSSGAGGGGSGGWVALTNVALVPGSAVNVSFGSPGGANGGNGGSTTFNGTTVTGGSGGLNGNGEIAGAGGAGGSPNGSAGSYGGNAGQLGGNGHGGAGGSTPYGAGGAEVIGAGANGNAPSGYGGGGGGGSFYSGQGAAGGIGAIIITYTPASIDSTSVSASWVPSQEGTFYVRLCADLPPYPDGVIQESNENNNCSSGVAFTVSGGPDLTAQAPTVSGTLSAGNTALFSGTVLNQGNKATAGGFTSKFQIDLTSSQFNNGDSYQTVSTATPALDSGGQTTVTGSWANLSQGSYAVRLCADLPPDPSGVIPETNESNNCSAGTSFTVGASCQDTQGYYCSGNDVYYRAADCSTSYQSTCSYQCSSGACVAPPSPQGNLQSGAAVLTIPALVPKGSQTTVSWSVQNASSCTVTGSNGDSWSGTSGSQTSAAITGQTIYTLSCTGLDSSTFTQTATVNVVPVFQEF